VILVAGGTGTLGTRLVPLLAKHDATVRVMTRDPGRAKHLEGPGVEVVVGDVRELESVAGAAEGAGTIISSIHGFIGPGGVTPVSVDRDGNANLVEAAVTNGSAFVLVSAAGVSIRRLRRASAVRVQRGGRPDQLFICGARHRRVRQPVLTARQPCSSRGDRRPDLTRRFRMLTPNVPRGQRVAERLVCWTIDPSLLAVERGTADYMWDGVPPDRPGKLCVRGHR
jgi:hypothetical protein